MNKKLAFLTLSLLLSAGVATSCGDDDDTVPDENPPAASTLPTGTFVGWSEGSNPYAAYIPSGNDSIVITKAGAATYDIAYLSPTHGRGVISGVSMTLNDTAYVFQKPVTVELNADGTAFQFSQEPDTIAMPNRNPQGGDAAWASYPATFESGYLTKDGERWEFTIKVYCNVRYVHQVIVREGAIGNRRSALTEQK